MLIDNSYYAKKLMDAISGYEKLRSERSSATDEDYSPSTGQLTLFEAIEEGKGKRSK